MVEILHVIRIEARRQERALDGYGVQEALFAVHRTSSFHHLPAGLPT